MKIKDFYYLFRENVYEITPPLSLYANIICQNVVNRWINWEYFVSFIISRRECTPMNLEIVQNIVTIWK